MRWAKVPTTPLLMDDLSAPDKLVYVALCAHANRDGVCYPKRATLAEYTSLSLRTISTSITNLCAAGVITQELRQGSTPLYKVLPLADVAIPQESGGIAPVATPLYTNETNKLIEDVKRLFLEVFAGHKLGNAAFVQNFIRGRGYPYKWYLELFELTSGYPFIRGANDKKLKFPLSFLLRESEEILSARRKYAPWQDTAQAVINYLQEDGE